MANPLDAKLEAAFSKRIGRVNLLNPCTTKSDLSSNDYLSLTCNTTLRSHFLERLSSEPQILGSGGSRVLDGNTRTHVALETRFRGYYNSSAALIFNSGHDANLALFGSLPQPGDVIVYDELIHASALDGMRMSRAVGSLHSFKHNSVASLETVLQGLLISTPGIRSRSTTVFVAFEAVYSMAGDIAPISDLVEAVERILPSNCAQIVVDEAHSTGLYGSAGRGIVSHLGLEKRVAIRLHTFGKAMACTGAVVLTSPLIRAYLINFARTFMFTTALSRVCLIATEASLDMVESECGDQLRDRLFDLIKYARNRVGQLSSVPSIPLLPPPPPSANNLISPVIPIVTPHAVWLAAELRRQGWATVPIIFPAVPKGEERIRMTIHAGNTEQEIDEFVQAIGDCLRGADRKRDVVHGLVFDAQAVATL